MAVKKQVTATDSPSEAKAQAFAAESEALGWTATVTHDTGVYEVRSTRGDEELVLHWADGKFIEDARYSCGGRVVSVRNASAAKKKMAVPASDALASNAKVVKGNGSGPRKPRLSLADEEERYYAPLPFDPAETSDLDVLAAVVGRTLVWRNTATRSDEEARIGPPPQRQLGIVVKNGRRILTFCAEGGPFRSIYLDAILEVR